MDVNALIQLSSQEIGYFVEFKGDLDILWLVCYRKKPNFLLSF